MVRMTSREHPDRTFVTGGAGFIGTELVASLLADGGEVTVFDDLSTADPDWSARFADQPRCRFIRGDASDPTAVRAAMPGHDRVVHLASGTDIAGGYEHPERDFRAGVVATELVCEAMRAFDVRELWYASSGVVYGTPVRIPTAEGDGPLLPESHYAAAKLAGEAIVSGFAHLYGWRSFAFRFGNTVGPRSDHGVVHDFVVKLLRDPRQLEILGDGSQAKPYVAVTDLVAGMRHAAEVAPAGALSILNVGPEGTLTVCDVAEIVVDALGLPRSAVEFIFTGRAAIGGGGWPGDTPHVAFDTSAMRALGWRPHMTAESAVRAAAIGIAARYRASAIPLLTAAERR
jgi:UDP-glucose 4-epimerase